eukprot:58821_1
MWSFYSLNWFILTLNIVNGELDYPLHCDGAVLAYTNDSAFGPGYHTAVPAGVCEEYYSQTSNFSNILKCVDGIVQVWDFDDAHCKGSVTHIEDFCEELKRYSEILDCQSYCGLDRCQYFSTRSLHGGTACNEDGTPNIITSYNDYDLDVIDYCGYYGFWDGAYKYVRNGNNIDIHKFSSNDCSGDPSYTRHFETIGPICKNTSFSTDMYSRDYIFGTAVDSDSITTKSPQFSDSNQKYTNSFISFLL